MRLSIVTIPQYEEYHGKGGSQREKMRNKEPFFPLMRPPGRTGSPARARSSAAPPRRRGTATRTPSPAVRHVRGHRGTKQQDPALVQPPLPGRVEDWRGAP